MDYILLANDDTASKRLLLSLALSCSCWLFTYGQQSRQVNLTVASGMQATFECILPFSGSFTVAFYNQLDHQLTANTIVISSNDRFSVIKRYDLEYDLIIKSVRQEDVGLYNCKILTNPPQTIRLFQLSMAVTPTMTDSSPAVNVSTGENVYLFCRATGTPPPTIKWFKLTPKGYRENLNYQGGTYNITKISYLTAGTYVCVADNGFNPTAQASIVVNIVFAPVVKLPYHQVAQQLGQNAMISCIVYSNPNATSYWQLNGQRLNQSSDKYTMLQGDIGLYGRSMSIVVHAMNAADLGAYDCIAANALGTTNDAVELVEWGSGSGSQAQCGLAEASVNPWVMLAASSVFFTIVLVLVAFGIIGYYKKKLERYKDVEPTTRKTDGWSSRDQEMEPLKEPVVDNEHQQQDSTKADVTV